jgi:D-alanyl-D-alanine carboxypeptidase (penicillin-binding protein 5/6)
MARKYTLGTTVALKHFSLHMRISSGRARGARSALFAGPCAVALLALLCVPAVRPARAAAASPAPPSLAVAAAAILDRPTGRFIFLLNAGTERPIASTTKIMTAKVVLDSGVSLGKVVAVGTMNLASDESEVGLTAGEKLTVNQLLQALLVASANDSARALAVAVGGTEQAFVAQMNATAVSLGLTHTHYENPHGLDTPGHYSTARDLSRLAWIELKDPRFASFVRMTSVRLPKSSGQGNERFPSTDTFMLEHPGWVYGVKTGHTDQAGSCLVSAGTYKGKQMIVTVLGAPDPVQRNRALLALYKYGASLYKAWRSPAAGSTAATVVVPYSTRPVALTLQSSFSTSVPPGARVTSTLATPPRVTLPLAAGTAIGTVTYKVDGKRRGLSRLTAARSVPLSDWQTRLRYRVWNTWHHGSTGGNWLQRGWRHVADGFRAAGRWFTSVF